MDSSFVGVTTDGSSTGDNPGASTRVGSESKASGTYQIVNYTLSLTYKVGNTKKLLFFLPEQPKPKMLRIGGRDFLLADGSAAKPQPPEPPYADFLTTKKMAKKQVLFSIKPNKSDQYDNIKITLQGYQWAKLTIDLPDSKATVKAANGLTPTVKDELKTGESVETMLVILVPAEHFDKNKDFKLWFGPLLNLKGQDVLQEDWLHFNIWKKL